MLVYLAYLEQDIAVLPGYNNRKRILLPAFIPAERKLIGDGI